MPISTAQNEGGRRLRRCWLNRALSLWAFEGSFAFGDLPMVAGELGWDEAKDARRRFDLNRQVNDYLGWYREIF